MRRRRLPASVRKDAGLRERPLNQDPTTRVRVASVVGPEERPRPQPSNVSNQPPRGTTPPPPSPPLPAPAPWAWGPGAGGATPLHFFSSDLHVTAPAPRRRRRRGLLSLGITLGTVHVVFSLHHRNRRKAARWVPGRRSKKTYEERMCGGRGGMKRGKGRDSASQSRKRVRSR